MAVYRSPFFAGDAVFVFGDLRTWGWITFGLGALGIVSGLAVHGVRESAARSGSTCRSESTSAEASKWPSTVSESSDRERRAA